MAQITYVECDPEYLAEKDARYWWDGILTYVLIAGFAIGLLIGAMK